MESQWWYLASTSGAGCSVNEAIWCVIGSRVHEVNCFFILWRNWVTFAPSIKPSRLTQPGWSGTLKCGANLKERIYVSFRNARFFLAHVTIYGQNIWTDVSELHFVNMNCHQSISPWATRESYVSSLIFSHYSLQLADRQDQEAIFMSCVDQEILQAD